MGRQIESFHNFLQACRMPRAVYEEAEDEVCLEVPIIGVTLRAPKVAPDDVNEADWHPKENLCEQAIEMLKEANVWGLRGVRLRMQLKEMGVDVGDGRRRSERCDDLDGPADVLVSWLKDGLYEEAKTEIQLLDERLSEFSQEDLSRMVAQIGLEVSYQLQDSPDDLAQLACGFLLRLLASLDGTGNVRDESVALGLIRIIEAVLLFHIPARPWGKPLVPVFCRVIRYLMERRMSPFMARNRLECIEFFFNAKVHKLLPKASDLHPPDAQKADKQLVKLAEELMLPEARRAQMIQAFEDEICPAAKDAFSGTCRLFGSLVNGFATVDADIDVGIHIPADKWDRYIWRGHWEHWRRRARINRRNAREETNEPVKEQTGGHFAIVFALRDLGAKVEERGYMVERVESARVPILRCDKGDIHVDISLSYEVVYYNSRLLKCYSLLAPQVVHMSLLVKKWAKVREVNDALQGTLSSYSYILLVIGFLQQRKLLPNLQDDDLIDKVAYEEGNTVEDEGKIDLRFFDFEKEGQTAEDARAYFDMAAMPCMHALMAEFFRFYAYEFNFYTQAISIKHTDLLQKIKLFFIHEDDEQNIWRYRKRLWLSILDPFEPNRVLGCTARGQERLCVELRRAMDLMVVGEVSRIFEPWDRRRERDFAYSLQQVIRYDPLYRSNRWLSPLRPLDDGYYEQVDYQRYQEPRYQEKNAPKAIKQEVTEEQILELIGDTKAIALQVVENKLGKIGISRAKKFEHFVLKWDGQEAYLQKLALPKPGKKDPRFETKQPLLLSDFLYTRDTGKEGRTHKKKDDKRVWNEEPVGQKAHREKQHRRTQFDTQKKHQGTEKSEGSHTSHFVHEPKSRSSRNDNAQRHDQSKNTLRTPHDAHAPKSRSSQDDNVQKHHQGTNKSQAPRKADAPTNRSLHNDTQKRHQSVRKSPASNDVSSRSGWAPSLSSPSQTHQHQSTLHHERAHAHEPHAWKPSLGHTHAPHERRRDDANINVATKARSGEQHVGLRDTTDAEDAVAVQTNARRKRGTAEQQQNNPQDRHEHDTRAQTAEGSDTTLTQTEAGTAVHTNADRQMDGRGWEQWIKSPKRRERRVAARTAEHSTHSGEPAADSGQQHAKAENGAGRVYQGETTLSMKEQKTPSHKGGYSRTTDGGADEKLVQVTESGSARDAGQQNMPKKEKRKAAAHHKATSDTSEPSSRNAEKRRAEHGKMMEKGKRRDIIGSGGHLHALQE